MAHKYKIYADICCLNRPLDNLEQLRIRLESEAVISILEKCEKGEWLLINTDAIQFEISKNSDQFKKEQLESIISIATDYINSNAAIEARAKELMTMGFKLYDALHLAFAETASVDIFLTTDDRLLRKAKQYNDSIKVKVENPVVWLMSILQEDDHEIR